VPSPGKFSKSKKGSGRDGERSGRGKKAQTLPATLSGSKVPEVVGVPVPDATWTRDRLIAKIAVDGTMANALTLQTYAYGHMGEHGSLMQIMDSLQEKIRASRKGSSATADELLTGQAVALNAIFNELMRRAATNFGSQLEVVELYMRLALKAQSQSRATLESLFKIKNPPNVAFVKQANIAQNQQVNNGQVSADPPARTEISESAPIELLEDNHGEWVVPRAAGEAIGGDQKMEAVGAIDGPQDKRRKAPR
jgi:hypothetical protein